jgi:PAS domain S-box-containing protein
MALAGYIPLDGLDTPLSASDVHLIADAIPQAVWLADSTGQHDFFNRHAVAFTGLPTGALVGRGWLSALHPDDARRAERRWTSVLRRPGAFELEVRVRRSQGGYHRVLMRGLPIRRPDGGVARWIGTWTDVEEERRLIDALDQAEQDSAAIRAITDAALAATPVVFAFVDRDLRVRRMNDAFAAFVGGGDEALGRKLADLVPDLWPEIGPRYQHVLATGETLRDIEVERTWPNGEVRQALNTYYPVRIGGEVAGTAVMSTDITELKRAQTLRTAILDHMVEGVFAVDRHGRITLLNRAAEQMLGWPEAEALGRRARDLWHHIHGDGSPRTTSEWEEPPRDQGHLGGETHDTFVTRDGVLLPVAYSIAAIPPNGAESGAVVVFRDTTDQQNAQRRAQRSLESLQWVGRIRDALDDDRLVLLSQPIVALDKRHSDSEELLVRMKSLTGDLIMPGTFLPIAEKYGLIADIDRWVIRRAAEVAAQGKRVEANISAWTIANIDVIPDIEQALAQTGADPANLVLEITETAFMRNMQRGEAFARALAALGCPLALDDFGTGFGGFTYLKRLPITYLKIDIEFVRELVSSPANQRVVEAIVALAGGLNKITIAEGVEDEATLEMLRTLGVDYAQGYLLGAPAPLRDHRLLTLW